MQAQREVHRIPARKQLCCLTLHRATIIMATRQLSPTCLFLLLLIIEAMIEVMIEVMIGTRAAVQVIRAAHQAIAIRAARLAPVIQAAAVLAAQIIKAKISFIS